MKEKPTTKELVNQYLNNSYNVFIARNLKRTASTLKTIREELNNTKPNYLLINSSFKVLQATMIVEYQGSDPHKTQCATFLKRAWLKAVKYNHSGVKQIFNNKIIISNRQNRVKARYTLGKLVAIIHRGMQTTEDKLIGLSILYMYVIDGIYGKDLRDYYLWNELSDSAKIEPNKLLRMKIDALVEYFGSPKTNFLIDGYDEYIRNAVAHASFYYDKKTEQMIYEERRKNITKKLSLTELENMYKKLDHVDELIMHMDQIMNVNECINHFRSQATKS